MIMLREPEVIGSSPVSLPTMKGLAQSDRAPLKIIKVVLVFNKKSFLIFIKKYVIIYM